LECYYGADAGLGNEVRKENKTCPYSWNFRFKTKNTAKIVADSDNKGNYLK
jgi:hypothetical protein